MLNWLRLAFVIVFALSVATIALESMCCAQAPAWKFVSGDSWRYRVVESETVDQPFVPDAKIVHLKSEQTFDVTVKIQSVDAKGSAKATVTVDRIRVSCEWSPAVQVVTAPNASIGVGKFNYDSQGGIPPRVETKALSDPLDQLVGATLELQISADGKVLSYKRSQQLTRAKAPEFWDLVGGAPLKPERLHNTLISWLVPLPNAKEFANGKWSRSVEANLWRDATGNAIGTYSLSANPNGAVDELSFEAAFRSRTIRPADVNISTVGPDGKFLFQTGTGCLRSAERTLAVEKRLPTSKIELGLRQTVVLQ